ncbi:MULTISPECIES: hypothetical protein [unclassified Mesorhizobium]|uniref:hypothetical protein n=1 Tax=unclassified Mesorhizobium TaxID=325217 RepID=UPI0003D0453A|nr:MULTISPECIES: hypothetical protein [unclassified Mesorhizobium]ESZ23384.1 hypothetical protein X734_26945 [Mesorhizobium sp. L2C084A000]
MSWRLALWSSAGAAGLVVAEHGLLRQLAHRALASASHGARTADFVAMQLEYPGSGASR